MGKIWIRDAIICYLKYPIFSKKLWDSHKNSKVLPKPKKKAVKRNCLWTQWIHHTKDLNVVILKTSKKYRKSYLKNMESIKKWKHTDSRRKQILWKRTTQILELKGITTSEKFTTGTQQRSWDDRIKKLMNLNRDIRNYTI